jgi:hypothetical protein
MSIQFLGMIGHRLSSETIAPVGPGAGHYPIQSVLMNKMHFYHILICKACINRK